MSWIIDDKFEKQIAKVGLLLDMTKEELDDYKESVIKYGEWRESDIQSWENYPGMAYKSNIKRMMMILRKEMIKLDKML